MVGSATTPGTDNEAIRESRDTLKDLTQEIKRSNEASSKLNKSMLALTFVSAFIVAIEFFTKVWPWLIDIFQKLIDF